MASVNVNFRVDENVKRECESLFDDLGISMTTALNMFLRACLRCNGLPLDLYLKPNEETLQVIEDVNHGKNLLGPFYSVDELMEALNEDD